MKENENSYNNNMSELDEEKVNYQEILFKYIIHWPWFIASVLACLIGAWVYLHFQTPVYQVSASIMIKNDKKNGGGNTARYFVSFSYLDEQGMYNTDSSLKGDYNTNADYRRYNYRMNTDIDITKSTTSCQKLSYNS